MSRFSRNSLLISLVTLACVVARAASAQETLVDNFEVGPFPAVTDDPTPGSTIQSQVGLSTADVINGSRTLEVEATANVTVSADVTPNNIRLFVPSDIVESSGVFELRYDAGGLDLTADGSDRFIVDMFGILVSTATLEVSLNAGVSTLSQVVTNGISSYSFLFDAFSVPGATTNVQDIAVRLTLSGPSLQQVRIEEIRTSGPLRAFGTPTIDGTKGPGEWDDAAKRDVFSGGLAGSTLYVMNDAANLYLAVEVQGDTDLTDGDRIEARFDDDLDLLLTLDDDGYLTNTVASDRHFDPGLLGYATIDTVQHGQDAAGRSAGVNFFEIAKPLASGDVEDFDLATGERVGLCVRYFENDVGIGSGNHPVSCVLVVNEQIRYDLIEIAEGPPPIPALPLWGTIFLCAALFAGGILFSRGTAQPSQR